MTVTHKLATQLLEGVRPVKIARIVSAFSTKLVSCFDQSWEEAMWSRFLKKNKRRPKLSNPPKVGLLIAATDAADVWGT